MSRARESRYKRPLSKDTLVRLCEELPVFPWRGEDLEFLVDAMPAWFSGYGALEDLDLTGIEPAHLSASLPEEPGR